MKNDRPGTTDEVRADLKVGVHWQGDWRFTAGKPGSSMIRIDGHSKDGPSPPEILLCALASCTAVDVVEILTKRKTPPTSLDVEVLGERRPESPRRILKAHLAYRIVGVAVDRAQAERAIEL